jgi:hypothetical protein
MMHELTTDNKMKAMRKTVCKHVSGDPPNTAVRFAGFSRDGDRIGVQIQPRKFTDFDSTLRASSLDAAQTVAIALQLNV